MFARTTALRIAAPANRPTIFQAQTRVSIIALDFHGIAGRSDQSPLPPIQASSSVCCEAPDLKPRSCTVTCTYIGPLPSAVDHKIDAAIDQYAEAYNPLP